MNIRNLGRSSLFVLLLLPSLLTAASTDLRAVMQEAYRLQLEGYDSEAVALLQRHIRTLEAQKEVEALHDDDDYVYLLSQLGDLYLQLHRWAEAEAYLSKAVNVARGSDNWGLLAGMLNNFGNLRALQGDYHFARLAFEESIELGEEVDGLERTTFQARLNSVRLLLLQKAELINQRTALVGSESGDPANLAWQRRLLQSEINQLDRQMLRQLRAQLVLTESAEPPIGIRPLQSLIQQLQTLQQQLPEQTAWLQRSAGQLAERLLAATDSRAESYVDRSQTLALLSSHYRLAGQPQKALQAAEGALQAAEQAGSAELIYHRRLQKAELLAEQEGVIEIIEAYEEAIESFKAIKNSFFAGQRGDEDRFGRYVQPAYLGLAAAQLKLAQGESGEAAQQQLSQVINTVEEMQDAEVTSYLANLQGCKQRRPLQHEWFEVSSHTALIYPLLLEKRLILLLKVGDQLVSQTVVATDSKQLAQTIQRFQQHLHTRSNNLFLYEAQQLYHWLIAPLESQLQALQIETLVFVASDLLRSIPLATLHDGERFLVEKYSVAATPGLALTDPQPLDKQRLLPLVAGLSDAVQGFSKLPSVRQELQQVRQLLANGSGDLLENRDYTAANLAERLRQRDYTLLHLATHALFSGDPDSSYLLTYDDKLNMNRLQQVISQARLEQDPLELITLSACQTAVGNGRAELGIAGIALRSGARSVLASLWFVDDEATAQLITRFYHYLLQEGQSKASALRAAQRELIVQPRFWHPSYWGAFVLIGNWL